MMKTGNTPLMISVALIVLATLMPAAPAQEKASAAKDAKPFAKGELEQLAAPIALYPDALVSQVLMASTYPLEIVQAERWLKKNKSLKGDALAKALEKQTWDPSVRSLINFPQVLGMMNERLDWTQKLGDAVLGQKAEVMDAVQILRKRARDAGQLKSTKEQTVTEKTIPPTETVATAETVIVIESASPKVIYVPTYNPTVVYGVWPYPSYPPAYYYPPSYSYSAAAWGVAAGVAVGVAWGYAWGGCHWGHHGHCDINVDVNRNVNHNRNIDRNKFSDNRPGNRPGTGGGNSWKHNPDNRRGVRYRDDKTAQKFDRGGGRSSAGNRNSYRGRSDSSRTGRTGGSRGSTAFGGGSKSSRSSIGKSSSRGKSSRYSGSKSGSSARRSWGSRGSRSSRGSRGSRGGGRSRGGGGRR